MTTRERIEAEIAQQEVTFRHSKTMSDYGSEKAHAAMLEADRLISLLRSILVDLPPAEMPFTLAEARESGEWFLVEADDIPEFWRYYRETDDDGNRTLDLVDCDYQPHDEKRLCGKNIKRLCDRQWWPVEGS